uniref:AIG1-type G domain-containing protein n=2 Tax=Haplochromis burtoni TaxID=8153 RepID=A0A3Q2VLD6_HAPBU
MEALCQSAAGLQENMSVKVVTPLEEDAAQKDDVTVPPTIMVMEGKAAGAQKYIKVEKLYRIVLLGNTEAVKSSLANAIFGEDVFRVDNTECQTESKSVHGRRITLINTPDLLCTNRSEEELKPEILRCVTGCTPEPHAFLIMLKVEKSTEQQQQKAVIEKISQYFSEEVFKYATVVFIQDGRDSDEMKMKDLIDQNKYLSDLMRKCKSRYHIINKYIRQGDTSQSQVTELLNTVDQIVKLNKGVCYTNKISHQGGTCSNNSVSKNDTIKLTGPASESVAKAFSGSTVVVLTPGSDVEEEIEEDNKKEDKEKEELDEVEEVEEEVEEDNEDEETEKQPKEEEEYKKDEKTNKPHSKERGQSSGSGGFRSILGAVFGFCLGLGTTALGSILATLGSILATLGFIPATLGSIRATLGCISRAVIIGVTAILGTWAMLKVRKLVNWAYDIICRVLAWIKKMNQLLQDLCQNRGVNLLVFVFYSLLLSWLFLKGPFAGTLILTQFLFLVTILAIIEF